MFVIRLAQDGETLSPVPGLPVPQYVLLRGGNARPRWKVTLDPARASAWHHRHNAVAAAAGLDRGPFQIVEVPS